MVDARTAFITRDQARSPDFSSVETQLRAVIMQANKNYWRAISYVRSVVVGLMRANYCAQL